MTQTHNQDLLLCAFLWLSVPDEADDTYDALCDSVQQRLSDEQWHELESMFNI